MLDALVNFTLGVSIGAFAIGIYLKRSELDIQKKRTRILQFAFIALVVSILLGTQDIVRGFNDGWNTASSITNRK